MTHNRLMFFSFSSGKNLSPQGFTLVELAIALMVIGLLIGGVLKGQELIENARITRAVKDINDYDTSVMIFRNTYNALPGDIKKPTRIPNCSGSPCADVFGSGTGTIQTTFKSIRFWYHLERAGLITGITEDVNYNDTSPLTSFEGYVIPLYSLTGNPELTTDPQKNRILLTDPSLGGTLYLNPVRAAAIDGKLDDGKPLSGGMVMATQMTLGVVSGSVTRNNCVDNTSKEYLHNQSALCLFMTELSSMQ